MLPVVSTPKVDFYPVIDTDGTPWGNCELDLCWDDGLSEKSQLLIQSLLTIAGQRPAG